VDEVRPGKKKTYCTILSVTLLVTMFSSLISINAAPPDWGTDTRLTFANGDSTNPRVLMDSTETIYVVWQDERDGDHNIFLKKSSDYGMTWSSDIKVTDTTWQSGWPRMAIDSNDVLHLLWLEEDETNPTYSFYPYDSDPKQILYKSSADGGITWSSPITIASNTGQMQYCGLDICVGQADAVHVSYSKYSPSKVYHRRSADGGTTWSSPIEIGSDQDAARPTAIAADIFGHVYVAFHTWGNTGDIDFVKSNDNGVTWGSAITLLGGYGWPSRAHLTALDDGHVFLTYVSNKYGSDHWMDPREVYIIISSDYASTWGPEIRLTYTGFRMENPFTVIDSDNNINIVWQDVREGNWEVYYTKLDINGNTLIDDTRLTDDPAISGHPKIVIDSSNTRHVYWHDNRVSDDNYEIFTKGDAQQPEPPVADAGPDQTVNEGDVVHLDGSTSHDPDGNVTKYDWDFDTNVDSDGDGDPENDVDANGPISSHVYGDNGIFTVTLTITDDQNLTATDTCNITVLNVDPDVSVESVSMNIEVGLRVAGRKYNDIGLTLYEDDTPIDHISIERLPGSPDDQMAWIPISVDFSKSYSASVTCIPEDPPDIGSNPVWIYLRSENGSINKIHHTFNVQQSMKRDSNHWNHVEPWEVELDGHFIGLPFEITAHVTDPGSDDIFLTYSYGSQNVTVAYLNNPPNPDPYPSPEVNPRDIIDSTHLLYEGPGTVLLTVTDDDGGKETATLPLG
jgi:hypothetical protein